MLLPIALDQRQKKHSGRRFVLNIQSLYKNEWFGPEFLGEDDRDVEVGELVGVFSRARKENINLKKTYKNQHYNL